MMGGGDKRMTGEQRTKVVEVRTTRSTYHAVENVNTWTGQVRRLEAHSTMATVGKREAFCAGHRHGSCGYFGLLEARWRPRLILHQLPMNVDTT